jgi:hypothetical protein
LVRRVRSIPPGELPVASAYLRDQTSEAVADLRELENARLDALQLALWDAAIAGDVRAATAILHIVKARVHLNGLEPVTAARSPIGYRNDQPARVGVGRPAIGSVISNLAPVPSPSLQPKSCPW